MQRITNPWMEFNGIRNTAVGALMTGQPTVQFPMLNATKAVIPGRDGQLIVSDGSYAPITITQELAVPDASKISEVTSWLRGEGALTFWDDSTKYRDAAVLTAVKRQSVSTHLAGQKFTVTFTCSPFKRLITETPIVMTEAGVFNGSGTEAAFPLLMVEGAGDVDLIVNGKVLQLALNEDEPLYIDCDACLAYTQDDGVLTFAGAQVRVVTEWPQLRPYAISSADYNNINWAGVDDGDLAKLTITPRWRWA